MSEATATTTGTTEAATTATGTTDATNQPAAYDWKSAGLDANGMSVVENKGWKAPSDMLGSYVNLEKLIGVPPEQVIKLPKEMNDATMGPVYDRLGRPKTPEEYKLPVPEGDTGEFAGIASKWFHEAGLSASQAGKVAAKWNEHVAEFTKKQMTDYTKSVEMDKIKLKTEWGDKHDSNIAVAKQAAVTFGVDDATISKLEKDMGFAGVYRFLFNIGSKLGEAEFIQGGGSPGQFAGTSVESARAQIEANKKDRSFIDRFNSKDPQIRGQARAESRRLHQIAYPGVTEA